MQTLGRSGRTKEERRAHEVRRKVSLTTPFLRCCKLSFWRAQQDGVMEVKGVGKTMAVHRQFCTWWHGSRPDDGGVEAYCSEQRGLAP